MLQQTDKWKRKTCDGSTREEIVARKFDMKEFVRTYINNLDAILRRQIYICENANQCQQGTQPISKEMIKSVSLHSHQNATSSRNYSHIDKCVVDEMTIGWIEFSHQHPVEIDF
jgi:hypothetical protein